MARFNIGDIVVQKSGGPKMTVRTNGRNVLCQWLVNGKLELGTFSEAVLELVKTEDEKVVESQSQRFLMIDNEK